MNHLQELPQIYETLGYPFFVTMKQMGYQRNDE